uniref:trafficking protein particle complex subunit 4 n=1 Tax=Myxine glutinosa TaxID=7769 RepID=UPI00358E255D
MTIFSVYVVNKAGGLIYQHDNVTPKAEVEKTLSYPLDITLKIHDERLLVVFGQRDGIKVGQAVLAVNGQDVTGHHLPDGTDLMTMLADSSAYPLSIRFGRPRLTANERLMLASMFHSLFAIGCQLSPEPHSSGIEVLETDSFRLYCLQALTGTKFIVITDPRHTNVDSILRRLYELYADFALKNPFYSLEMPIRCDLFDQNLKSALEASEKSGSLGLSA